MMDGRKLFIFQSVIFSLRYIWSLGIAEIREAWFWNDQSLQMVLLVEKVLQKEIVLKCWIAIDQHWKKKVLWSVSYYYYYYYYYYY